jgi:hypothetical protein
MPAPWQCPDCGRAFTRKNQRHACGTGDRSHVLRNRPAELVTLYASLEAFVRSFGAVEFVTRERYVLLRSVRIFADLVIMADAIRVAIHLPRKVEDALFSKVVSQDKKVTHVAKVRTQRELAAIKGYLKEAYAASL